ncbi:hypothetical protein D3C80_1582290 [compost metagenome]
MHVDSIKARTVERCRHFNVGVHALLTQNSDLRTRTGRNIRSRNILVDIERELHVQARIVIVGFRLMLLVSAFWVITQALHLPGGFSPPHAQRRAAFAEHRMTVRFNDKAIARHGFTQIMHAISQTVLRQ